MTSWAHGRVIGLPLGVDGVVAGPATDEAPALVLTLFDRHRDGTYRYVRTFGLSVTDSEDVTQEVFLALWRHLVRGGARTNLAGWIFRVAHNLALRRRARDARWLRLLATGAAADPPRTASTPEDAYLVDERQVRLRAVLRAIPARDRRCLLLRAEGLRYREIAQVLGMSLGGVAKIMTRTLTRLRRADEA